MSPQAFEANYILDRSGAHAPSNKAVTARGGLLRGMAAYSTSAGRARWAGEGKARRFDRSQGGVARGDVVLLGCVSSSVGDNDLVARGPRLFVPVAPRPWGAVPDTEVRAMRERGVQKSRSGRPARSGLAVPRLPFG